MATIQIKDAAGNALSLLGRTGAGSVLSPNYISEGFSATTAAPLTDAATGTAYAIGDAIGATFEIVNARKTDGGLCRIQQIQMIINDVAIGANSVTLWLFRAAPNAAVDNAAYTPNYALGIVNAIGSVTLSGQVVGSAGAIYSWAGNLLCNPSGTSIWGVTVATNTFTLTTATERRIILLGEHA